jgi:RES domain-containing protein
MIVYRLSKEKYKNDLTGSGAEKSGGRWNSKGTAILYTGQSRALCTTEIAVHAPLGIIPTNYWLTTIFFPDNIAILKIERNKLPNDWKSFPHPHATQVIGDKFITKGKFMVMEVPSAVVQGDFNYLLNPSHLLFSSVKITETELFEFDERLFTR